MTNNLFDLTGEVAVVIGATGVLGGGLAEGLAAAGAIVAVLGRNRERGDACVQRIVDKGSRAQFFSTDSVSAESLTQAHREIETALGSPTVLVNAAGGNDPKVTVTAERPIEKIALDDWRASFDMNLVGGALLPCQEFGSAMAARGKGSIINIASVSADLAGAFVGTPEAAWTEASELSRQLHIVYKEKPFHTILSCAEDV